MEFLLWLEPYSTVSETWSVACSLWQAREVTVSTMKSQDALFAFVDMNEIVCFVWQRENRLLEAQSLYELYLLIQLMKRLVDPSYLQTTLLPVLPVWIACVEGSASWQTSLEDVRRPKIILMTNPSTENPPKGKLLKEKAMIVGKLKRVYSQLSGV